MLESALYFHTLLINLIRLRESTGGEILSESQPCTWKRPPSHLSSSGTFSSLLVCTETSTKLQNE